MNEAAAWLDKHHLFTYAGRYPAQLFQRERGDTVTVEARPIGDSAGHVGRAQRYVGAGTGHQAGTGSTGTVNVKRLSRWWY